MGNSLSRSPSWHPDHSRVGDVMEAIATACHEFIATEKIHRELKQKKEERRRRRRQQQGPPGQAADERVPGGHDRGPRGNHSRDHAPEYDPGMAPGANPYTQAYAGAQPPHEYPFFNQPPQASRKGHGPFAMPPTDEDTFPEGPHADAAFPNRATGFNAPYAEDYAELHSPSGAAAARGRRPKHSDPRRQARGQPHPQAYYMSGARGSTSGRSGASGGSGGGFDGGFAGPMGRGSRQMPNREPRGGPQDV